MHDLSTSKERRKYFRIRNKLFLSYELELTEENNTSDGSSTPQNATPQASPQITLLRELSEINDENKRFLKTLSSDQASTYSHVQTMNNRIVELSRQIIYALDIDENSMMEVDISGGGLSFESKQQLSVGQKLNIEMILMPQYFGIVLHAEVVDCSTTEELNNYRTSMEFTQIDESDRDVIIGHIFKTQSKVLRDSKESEK